MLRYVLQRLLLTMFSLLGVIVFTFLLIHFIPGDPVDQLLGEQASQEDRVNLRRELGLDQPLSAQFKAYVGDVSRFHLGQSLVSKTSVSSEIAKRFPATVELSFAAMVLALAWGIPLGLWAAVHVNSWRDRAADLAALVGMSLPGVFLGPALVYIFAVTLDWFPVSERAGIESLFLPALSLALPLGAVIARMTRAAVLDVLAQDFMRTARAKGAGPIRLYFHHALRNALIPLITIVGLQLGALLTGTVITETIFDWPGIGSLIYGAIQRRDYPMVQGCVLFVACIYVLVNFVTDLSYSLADPKVRLS